MISKTVTYKDYNGTQRTETYYFDLSQAELMDMQFTTEGGLDEQLKKITDGNDMVATYKFFRDLVRASYGVKSADGRRFEKSEALTTEFTQTKAYSIIFMGLASDSDEAARFCNGVIPDELKPQIQAKMADN